MPDGTVIQGVPDGMSKADISAKYAAHLAKSGAAQAPKPGYHDNGEGQMVPDSMSMMDMLKRAAQFGMAGVKGANDSLMGAAALVPDAGVQARSLITGEHPQLPSDMWKQYSDKTIPQSSDPVDRAFGTASGLAAGAAVPVPGGAASGPTGRLAESFARARNAGYVVPPTAVRPTIANRTLETLLGTKELNAEATGKNLAQASANLTQQFGLPAGSEITHSTMDAVRANAGKAYEAVSSLGPQYAALVDQVKGLRNEASKLYRQNASNYNVATEKQADALWEQAQHADNVLGGALKQQGGGDVYDAYLAARKTIAQTHDVDKAIIDSRAEVKPQTFATAFTKEKPQSGALLDLGRSVQAFGPAFNTNAAPGALSLVDKTLLGSGLGLNWLAHKPGLAGATIAAALARGVGRKALLSGPVQDMMLLSPEQKQQALAAALLRGGVGAQGQE
jgi:hypothetical protein